MENKLKHLEFIQTVIDRLSRNSLLLKGWGVTLISALFALAAKDSNKQYILLAYFPILTFWVLSGYYLSQERRFRALYDQVRVLPPDKIDFSMDTKSLNVGRNTWGQALISRVPLIFYLTLAISVLIVWYFI